MPQNKNSMIRYQALDKCFSNRGRMFFIEDLIEACSNALEEFNYQDAKISRRQVLYDIRFMESEQGWNISLERHNFGRRVFYRYSDPSFSINNSPLNPEEWLLLKNAISLTNRVFGDGPFSGIGKLISKMDQKEIHHNMTRFVSYDENPYVEGLDVLPDLFNYIVNRRVINVLYEPFNASKTVNYLLNPLHLRLYQGRWFFFGYDSDKACISTLGTDRIRKVQETNIPFDEAGYTAFEDWFEDVIGVTRFQNQEPEEVVVKITGDSIPYVLSKPMHGSQKVKSKTGQELIVSLKVIPNYELDKLLLGYGKNLTVLSPATYKDHFNQIIAAMAQNAGLTPPSASNPE